MYDVSSFYGTYICSLVQRHYDKKYNYYYNIIHAQTVMLLKICIIEVMSCIVKLMLRLNFENYKKPGGLVNF